MFGLFKTTWQDNQLGLLTRSGGYWRTNIEFDGHENILLCLAGTRGSPDHASLNLANQLPAQYEALAPQLQVSLFEHYLPYRQAIADGEIPEPPRSLPMVERAEGLWPHLSPVHVLIEGLRGSPRAGPTVEIALAVAWDEEHVLGARFQDWQPFELCGSVRGV
jgi:hypothetical protein